MYKGKTFLAVIPARGGSKRLNRKNVIELGGKPLITWTIEAALACQFFDEVMVTTDDDEIAGIARKNGATVPFIRPAFLATDKASSFDVVKHTLEYYRDELGREFDFVVMLQPTSPLRSSKNILEAVESLTTKNADAIISVCEAEHSPLWMGMLSADDSLSEFSLNEIDGVCSQDLPKYYRLNGAIYICNVAKLIEEGTFFISGNLYAYKMNLNESVDIDTMANIHMVEIYMKHSKEC